MVLNTATPPAELAVSDEEMTAAIEAMRADSPNPIDDETRAFLDETASEIRRLAKRAAGDMIEIGRMLIEVREKIGNGAGFTAWVNEEFSWSRPTAYRFMAVARNLGGIPASRLSAFSMETLYALASPAVKPEMIELIVERSVAGEQITPEMIRELSGRTGDDAEPENDPPNVIDLVQVPESGGFAADPDALARLADDDDDDEDERMPSADTRTKAQKAAGAIGALFWLPEIEVEDVVSALDPIQAENFGDLIRWFADFGDALAEAGYAID